MVDMKKQTDLGLILLYNDSNRTNIRTPLSIAQSLDKGETWKKVAWFSACN